MSSVIYEKFGADSSANFDILSVGKVSSCPDLPVAVIRVNRDGRSPLDGANAAAARLLGYELPRRLIRITPQQLYVDPDTHRQIVHELIGSKHATTGRDCLVRRKDGSCLWVSVHAQMVCDSQNQPGQINLVFVDITDRKAVEAELEASDSRFRAIIDNAAEGILLADSETKRLLSGNPRMCELLGYTMEEIERLSLADLHPPDALPLIEERFARQRRGEMTRASEVPLIRKDGTRLYADINAFMLSLQGRKVAMGFFHDVTNRRKAEGEAKQYQGRLRSLALELSLAQEQERRRLAGHLHDEVGQLLSLAQIRLSLIEPSVMHPECQKGAREMKTLLERALGATRSLTFQLSHPAVYDLGFVAGAEWLAEDVKELYGLEVELLDDRRPKPLELRSRVLLLQCVRELLVNVARHAGVKKATVRMSEETETVRVVVEDQGIGFELKHLSGVNEKSGFGLFSIRERLRSLGGAVEIQSSPGLGTCIALDVPLSRDKVQERPR